MVHPEAPIHFWTAGEKRYAAVAIVLFLLLAVHVLAPEQWVPVFLVSATFPFWSFFAIPFGIGAATTRVPRFVLYALLIVSIAHIAWVWVPGMGNYPDAGLRSARVAAANLYVSNSSPRAMTAELSGIDADVLILQEVDEKWRERITEAAWYRDFPFRHEARRYDAYGMMMLSKLPLLEPEVLTVADVPQLTAQIQVNDRRIRLLGIHLKPPLSDANLVEQRRMVRALRSWVEQPGAPPVLVMGDANVTPWNDLYGELAGLPLTDVTRRVGEFPWPTWAPESIIPGFTLALFPVDHVFASELIRIHRLAHTTGNGSDHRPVVADISW